MIPFIILGTTLVWVAILVIIVVYNFALTAFALFRSTLDPYGELPFFGYNLFQTFIVILRYGIIGELYEVTNTKCFVLLFYSKFKRRRIHQRHRWQEPRQVQEQMVCMILCHIKALHWKRACCPPLFWSQFRCLFESWFLSVRITI